MRTFCYVSSDDRTELDKTFWGLLILSSKWVQVLERLTDLVICLCSKHVSDCQSNGNTQP